MSDPGPLRRSIGERKRSGVSRGKHNKWARSACQHRRRMHDRHSQHRRRKWLREGIMKEFLEPLVTSTSTRQRRRGHHNLWSRGPAM